MNPEADDFMRLFHEKFANSSPPPQLELETDVSIESSAMLGGEEMPNLSIQHSPASGEGSSSSPSSPSSSSSSHPSSEDPPLLSPMFSLDRIIDIQAANIQAQTPPLGGDLLQALLPMVAMNFGAPVDPLVEAPNEDFFNSLLMANILQQLFPAQPAIAQPNPANEPLLRRTGAISLILDAARNGSGDLSYEELCELAEMEAYAKRFKRKRTNFKLTHEDVRIALQKRYDTRFSNFIIGRFEGLNLTFKKMTELRPLLEELSSDVEKAIEGGVREQDLRDLIRSNLAPNFHHPDLENLLARKDQTVKRQRTKTLFSGHQEAALFALFNSNPHPSVEEVRKLSSELELQYDVVKTWFSNHRYKLRRRARQAVEGTSQQ